MTVNLSYWILKLHVPTSGENFNNSFIFWINNTSPDGLLQSCWCGSGSLQWCLIGRQSKECRQFLENIQLGMTFVLVALNQEIDITV